MVKETIESLLSKHEFLAGMSPAHLEFVAGCGSNVRYDAGEYIYREGEPADQFLLIRRGKVSLEIFVPGRGPLVIETIAEGDVLGWSWLFPPYRRRFDARALEVTRAISLDGACLRAKCEEDHDLGYDIVMRFSQVVIQRLQATRLRLTDMYGRAYWT
jgi:CRP/FNR family cyclic AMP-dependent transcriptional regulator